MSKGNLITKNDRTPSERRASAKKAGIASGAARRQKKALKELLEMALKMPAASGRTNAEDIVSAMIKAAQSGDVKAFIAIRDTIGEKPVDKLQVGLADNIAEQLEDVGE